MKRQVFILTLIGILSQYAFGQISEGGKPISFSLDIDTQKEKIPVLAMPTVNAKALLAKTLHTENKLQTNFSTSSSIEYSLQSGTLLDFDVPSVFQQAKKYSDE